MSEKHQSETDAANASDSGVTKDLEPEVNASFANGNVGENHNHEVTLSSFYFVYHRPGNATINAGSIRTSNLLNRLKRKPRKKSAYNFW